MTWTYTVADILENLPGDVPEEELARCESQNPNCTDDVINAYDGALYVIDNLPLDEYNGVKFNVALTGHHVQDGATNDKFFVHISVNQL